MVNSKYPEQVIERSRAVTRLDSKVSTKSSNHQMPFPSISVRGGGRSLQTHSNPMSETWSLRCVLTEVKMACKYVIGIGSSGMDLSATVDVDGGSEQCHVTSIALLMKMELKHK